MKIVEIFRTIQGEGPRLGMPSLFIRLGGCNLRCQFKGEACDTPYAVFTPQQLTEKNPALKFGYDKWIDLSCEEVAEIIERNNLKNIVWTGGESFLWQGEILKTINRLKKRGFHHEFETNGTIALQEPLLRCEDISFNVSVKLKSSNQEAAYEDKRINKAALSTFRKWISVYKFVITNPIEDIKEIRQIVELKKLDVYVMPEGLTRGDVLKNSPAVIQMAIDNGWRFTPREHINVYDQRKAV